ncbi:sensor histidine kinase [Catenuloplanes atrovinosus]|uniref:histidine kinase n=1 Tax=Catenuloplanes atrovinosus TaxID=137266 RepID=A0AAE3YNC8_9ACTN|nr:histidine kinase [Catenuloplanes atrovinosus]MDR7275373.1 signal transduction histidine kinase [Catenuloplanes atrovinosus]
MPRRRYVIAAVAAALVAAPATVAVDVFNPADRPPDAPALALVVAGVLSLAWLRDRPLAVLAVVTSSTTAYLWCGYPYGPVMVTFLIAVYGVAVALPLTAALPASAAALAMLLTHIAVNDAALPGLLGLLPGSAWAVVPFAVGMSVRMWREGARRDREDQLRRHLDAERLRMAREVHDIVGHGLAAIHMQAGVALHVLGKDPGRAEAALRAIATSSAAALEELRHTLAVVRGGDGTAPRQPSPGLDGVDDLVARMRDAGLRVALTSAVPPGTVPAAIGLAAYRVIQESLTNVLRHGPVKSSAVTLSYHDGTVEVRVVNPDVPGRGLRPGTGIAGMRDRVEALGGHFTAGFAPAGRFEVVARLPTEERP